MTRRIRVLRGEMPGGAAFDTAVSRTLLDSVARGEQPESLRLWRPPDALAFSVTDRARLGFGGAVAAARAAGFEPFLRLAGGHAAVYTRASLAFAWTVPAPDVRTGIEERFAELSGLVAAALGGLGVDARVGEVAGEYCPGAHSVNARGRAKLMGVGQRVIRGAAHVGGVIVVGEAARARAVLEPVYEALGLSFAPDTVGSLEAELGSADAASVADVLLAELATRHELADGELPPELLDSARLAAPRYAC